MNQTKLWKSKHNLLEKGIWIHWTPPLGTPMIRLNTPDSTFATTPQKGTKGQFIWIFNASLWNHQKLIEKKLIPKSSSFKIHLQSPKDASSQTSQLPSLTTIINSCHFVFDFPSNRHLEQKSTKTRNIEFSTYSNCKCHRT